jgi:hypothetical protein
MLRFGFNALSGPGIKLKSHSGFFTFNIMKGKRRGTGVITERRVESKGGIGKLHRLISKLQY